MPHQWRVPAEHEVVYVSAPMFYEELQDYTEESQQEGWRILGYEPAGKFLPQKYLVVLARPRYER